MTDVLFNSSGWVLSDPAGDTPLRRSIDRLLREDYRPAEVMHNTTSSDWPGDLAGRLLLSLSRGARVDPRIAARAVELHALMMRALEPLGYIGAVQSAVVDEQQVACHGWVAAGLVQFSESFDDPSSLQAAERIVDELILPAVQRLDEYPLRRPRTHDGGPSGTATATIGQWRLSSDTWCILLSLNALVPVYQATGRSDLGAAIRGFVRFLDAVDLVEQQAQLHATLSAARNLAAFAEVSGDESALKVAVRLYGAYVDAGRTLNYSTYNWFGREDSWTEPCAVVDSIGLALALWRVSGNRRFLADVRRIEQNAIGFAQRHDGSFGLDSVTTPSDPVLRPVVDDAWWCCTVRGALGIFDLRDRSVLLSDGELHVLFPRTGSFHQGGWLLELEYDQPSGAFVITLVEAPGTETHLPVRIHGLAGAADATGALSLSSPRFEITLTPAGEITESVPGGHLRFRDDVLIARTPDGHEVRLNDVRLPGEDGADGFGLALVEA